MIICEDTMTITAKVDKNFTKTNAIAASKELNDENKKQDSITNDQTRSDNATRR